jgi:hypothetical protein
MKQLTSQNNFVYLCGALIALLFSASLVQEFSGTWGEDIFTLASMLMLVVSIKSVHTDMTWKKTVYVLLGFLFVLSILAKVFAFSYSVYLNLIILLLFFAGSFWTAYKQILFEGKVDTNKMIGSLSLYLLLGLMWTILYLILIELDSQAFSGLESGSWKQNFSQVAYYSFVTLTTLGYGDILPVNKVAQFFVYMEAVIGVFYMAIIVSSLISLRLASLEKKE